CWCSRATAFGVAWMPRIVAAGSPGIRWTMKKQMIVTPTATGRSSSSRRTTNPVRPIWVLRLLAQPDVLHVVVAERRDVEAVHAGRGGVGVRGVVEEGHERVARRLRLDRVVQRLPGRGGQGLLRVVRGLDHGGIVVGGEERPGPGFRVDGERRELVGVGYVHRPVG